MEDCGVVSFRHDRIISLVWLCPLDFLTVPSLSRKFFEKVVIASFPLLPSQLCVSTGELQRVSLQYVSSMCPASLVLWVVHCAYP